MPNPRASTVGPGASSPTLLRTTGLLLSALLSALLLSPVVPIPPAGAVGGAAVATTARWGETVSVEPTDRYRSVDAIIAGARRSVDLAIYELSDPTVEALLLAAARRGVDVRVLLDRAWHGARVNRPAALRLAAAGVAVRWATPTLLLHEKALTADGQVLAVMTGNLVADPGDTRDLVVLDRDRPAVAAADSVFDADWDHRPVRSGADTAGLVWSPGAEQPLIDLIHHARTSLAVENEEMASPAVTGALEAAARRGVRVEVTMSAGPGWTGVLARLARAGVEVATYPDSGSALFIHAKVLVADGAVAFIGSQNFSTASLDDNRELGLVTTDPAVVATAAGVLATDFGGARPFGR